MARIFFTTPTIFIEITNTTLTMSTMLETHGRYHFKNIHTQPLKMLEVINGVIFNPSALFLMVMQQLQIMGLTPTKCKAIISLPDLNISTSDNTIQHCAALQAALCCAKTGLTILRVISLSLNSLASKHDEKFKQLKNTPNLLKPFQSQTYLPRNLGIIGAFLLIAGSSYYCFNQITALSNHSNHVQRDIDQLKKMTETAQQTILKSDDIKKKIQTTQATITTIQNFLAEHASYAPLLKIIAELIPEQIILTTLELKKPKPSKSEQSAKLKKKQPYAQPSQPKKRLFKMLTLKGQSWDADKIIVFNRALSSQKQFKNIRLTQLKRLKLKKTTTEEKSPFRYAFSLQAAILL